MGLSEKSLKKRVAIGTVWVLLLRFALRGIGLISTMILARILVPEDYGLIALGYSVYTFIEMLAAFGFDMVLVQKAKLERSDYDSAWTARLICYTVLAIVFAALSDVAAAFYMALRSGGHMLARLSAVTRTLKRAIKEQALKGKS